MLIILVRYRRLGYGPVPDTASESTMRESAMRREKVNKQQWRFARKLEAIERLTAKAFPQAHIRFWLARREYDTEEPGSPVGPSLVIVAQGQEIRDGLSDLHKHALKSLKDAFRQKPRPKQLALATCHIEESETPIEGQVWDDGDEWDLMEELELEDFVPLSVEDPFVKDTPGSTGEMSKSRYQPQGPILPGTKTEAICKWVDAVEIALWGSDGVLTRREEKEGGDG